ncbi:DNA-binding transcriptional regulator, LysR family [Nitratireductor aquibiodomus]|uniref:DNA-binding transcriptional regulator, LysR family n=1 Tax=Nitratireductor aquibiodomus TaxID=204799 RepID=A0A1H4JSJ2_9HYPH|nr:LysR family transcriptional regulator [Nitratireductor aquibiodomus]SEB49270.1 DNA-binding transcriptional regulator, LysR family [Nitratireductor aquibiodomus]
MSHPDLNLLIALDALLSEGSVAAAARRLNLSPSATSRALARLRETTGDPLLVQAGRRLVPTPRALELRETVGALVEDAQTMLRPQENLDLGRIERDFTLRTSDGFVENYGPALIARLGADAPGLRLRFVLRQGADNSGLRNGHIDLETGVVNASMGPEFRTQALFRDRFVGAMRADSAVADDIASAKAYATRRHVDIARHVAGCEHPHAPIDDALALLGLRRDVAVIVGGFSSVLALARETDLVATVPDRHTANLRHGLSTFELPFPSPQVTVSMLWHPRLENDPLHRWVRQCLKETCARTV